MELLRTLKLEIQDSGIEIAVQNFLHGTEYLTKNVQNFFLHLQLARENIETLPLKNIDFSDLYIVEKTLSKKTTRPITKSMSATVVLESEQTMTKTVTISNIPPTTIRRAQLPALFATPFNVIFDHKSISNYHAEMKIEDDRVCIRDLGSECGTFKNNVEIGRSGISSSKRILANNDRLQLG